MDSRIEELTSKDWEKYRAACAKAARLLRVPERAREEVVQHTLLLLIQEHHKHGRTRWSSEFIRLRTIDSIRFLTRFKREEKLTDREERQASRLDPFRLTETKRKRNADRRSREWPGNDVLVMPDGRSFTRFQIWG